MAFALSIAMVITMLPVDAFAETTTFSDMPNDWSTNALENAVKNGLLNGSNGKIMPKENLTRAQMATVINRAFGAENIASISKFTDVKASDWFFAEMSKAVAMKTFQGSGDKLNPNNSITREEAFVVIARALNLGKSDKSPNGFNDLGSISEWAKGEVFALINNGYIQGANGKVNPKGFITRAEFAQLMDNIIKGYISNEGEYTLEVEGNLMINAPGVVLKESNISGDLIIGDGVGNGEVTLEDVVVEGRLLVRGGGKDSIVIKGSSTVGSITIARIDGVVRVFAEDGTEIGEVTVDGSDDVIIEGTFTDIIVLANEVTVWATDAQLTNAVVEGNESKIIVGENSIVDKLVVSGENSEIQVLGTVKEIETTNTASDTKIVVSEGGSIEEINANGAGTQVEGEGTVTTVNANSNDVLVTVNGTKVVAAEGTTGVLAGDKEVIPGGNEVVGQTPPVVGGGGVYVPPVQPVIAISVDKTALYLDINDNENNSATIIATISPTNATSKNVTWTSSNKDVATVADGVVTAVAEGTATITATSNNGKKATTTVTVLNKLEENTVAVIGTKQYDSLQNALAAVGDGNVVIELIKDARLEYGARDAYGNESTQKVTIKGNGKELTLHQTDSDWSSIGLTGADAIFALEDVNVVKTTVGGNGAWNNHAINFSSKIELTNTTFSNAINLSADAKLTGVTITEDREYYGIWIGANGQTVTIEDTTVTANTNGGRGIKISDQYIGTPQLVNLSVSNSTFNTAKKSAIIVGSEAGAKITIDNLNIENVQADKINAVWVDEGWAQYQDKVTVTGGTKTLEGAVARIGDTGYLSLQAAINAAVDGSTINVIKDCTLIGATANNKDLTFVGNSSKPKIEFPQGKDQPNYQTYYGCEFTFENLTLQCEPDKNYQGIQPDKVIARNCVINGKFWGYAKDLEFTDCIFNQETSYNIWTYGSNVTFENCEFNSAGRSVLIYNESATLADPAEIIFKNCTFSASSPVAMKAAIDIDTRFGSFNVEIENCSASGFSNETEAGGTVISEGFVHLKATDKGELTVSIDDKLVYPTVLNATQNKGYNTIQAAIDDAVVGNNIIEILPGDYGTESINIVQEEGVNITLEAVGEVVLKNQFKISGAGRSSGTETLTIKGFTFDFSNANENVEIILATAKLLDDTNNYAHNISIEENIFMGNTEVDVVAIKTNSAFGLDIIDCEGIGLHSLGQIQGQSKYFTVSNCTVTGGESGINYYGPSDAVITGLTVEGTGYGVRAGQSSGVVTTATLTISDSNLNTLVPVWLRGDAPGTVTITNSNLEPTEDGPMIYDVAGGNVNITIDGAMYVTTEDELRAAVAITDNDIILG